MPVPRFSVRLKRSSQPADECDQKVINHIYEQFPFHVSGNHYCPLPPTHPTQVAQRWLVQTHRIRWAPSLNCRPYIYLWFVRSLYSHFLAEEFLNKDVLIQQFNIILILKQITRKCIQKFVVQLNESKFVVSVFK